MCVGSMTAGTRNEHSSRQEAPFRKKVKTGCNEARSKDLKDLLVGRAHLLLLLLLCSLTIRNKLVGRAADKEGAMVMWVHLCACIGTLTLTSILPPSQRPWFAKRLYS